MPKSKVKTNANTNRTKRTAAQKLAARKARVDPVAALLYDPCNGDATVAMYNGEGGYSQRFVKTFSVTTGAADTALTYSFYPGANMASGGAVATGATVLTNQYGTSAGPGIAYLTANANKWRAKAACVEMWSSQAPLNITGTIAFGLLSATQYQSGSAQTVDGLVNLLTHQTKLTADIVECVWQPGPADQFFVNYATLPSTLMPLDSDDRHVIAFAGTGLPPNTSYTFRITYVCEWVPKSSLEIATTVGGGGDSQHTYNVVSALNSNKPGWYARLKSHAQQFARQAVPVIRDITHVTQNYGPHVLKAASMLL
jgi:hypothetical protein